MTAGGSILFVGVGGQGVLMASQILAAVCLHSGCDVKKSEVHGMAQRGGMVFSHVRFGTVVYSPVIEEGEADALVALEWAEALRWASFVKPSGVVITASTQVIPPAACTDRRTWRGIYPAQVARSIGQRELYWADAHAVARAAGVVKAENIVLLGMLSTRLDFAAHLWEEAIRTHVPSAAVEANLNAFAAGRRLEPTPPAEVLPGPARSPRRYAVEVIDAWCKGCDICVRVCPEDCLRLDAGGVARCVDAQACTGCRLCEYLCPDFAIAVHQVEVATHG